MKEKKEKHLRRAQTTPDVLFGPVFIIETPCPSPGRVFHGLEHIYIIKY